MGIAMLAIDRFLLLIRDLRRNQRGMALPTAMLAMTASLGFAGAAVMSSVNVQQGSHRDSDSKSAIAAADAGASIALLRLNRYASAFSLSSPCLGVSNSMLVLSTASTDGWCPPVAGTVGGSTYVYRSTPAVGSTAMTVVATGTSGEVSRRIAITFKTTTVGSAFAKEGLIGRDELKIDNSADVRVGAGTNGNVIHGNANVCGSIRKGVGKIYDPHNNASQCAGYGVTEGNASLPPVSSFMPSDIASNNSNYRLVTCTKLTSKERVPAGCQEDSYSDKWKGTEPFNPSTLSRTISTSNNTTLTLGGGDYFICRLYLRNGSHLVMKEGAQVRVFFDTPENCGLKAGEKQIDIGNNADITATGYQPEIGKFDLPGFYVMGSESISTTIEFSNNGNANEFILYAPNSHVRIKNSATYTGVIAGRTVHFENATIRQDKGFKPPEIGGATLYERQSYVECTGATASPPNANC